MNLPFDYERSPPGRSAASTDDADFDSARVVILPVPLDRTTSYVPGTRNGPHEILVASSHMELWDEETQTDVHGIGIFTLPEMELPFAVDGRGDAGDPARRVRARHPRQVSGRPRRRAFDHAAGRRGASRRKHQDLSVLQIDAHADLRDSFMGTPHNHACAMRRTLEYAPLHAGRHPQPVAGGSGRGPLAADDDLLRLQHAAATRNWIDRVVDSLSDDGVHHDRLRRLRSGDHAGGRHAGAGRAVAGTRRWRCCAASSNGGRVVGCDIVELCPMPGNVAPNFLCAKLIYKILSYRFSERGQARAGLRLLQRLELALRVAR